MIIDKAIPEPYEVISDNYSLNCWQKGVVDQIFRWQSIIKSGVKLTLSTNPVKMINMGRSAGHTYLGRALSLKTWPLRTKVYASSSINFHEYMLINSSGSSHEPVDILHEEGFTGYHGDPVELVVVDLANQPVRQFQKSIEKLISSIPVTTMILLLHPSTGFDRTDHQAETVPW